ncbi:MAG: hypothetical protein HQK87_11045 [Nitrospinae bacterium]|nr:hypothetical protein [Nitrospinota bacterium]
MMNRTLTIAMALALFFAPMSAIAAPEEGAPAVTAAVAEGDAVSTMLAALAASPESAEAAIQAAVLQSPELMGEIVTAALKAGVDPVLVVSAAIGAYLDGAGPAVTAAVAFAPEMEQDIIGAAILAGADPTVVAAASAAGKAPPSPFAPAVLPNVGIGRGGVTPFGVGIVMGGNAASPS